MPCDFRVFKITPRQLFGEFEGQQGQPIQYSH